MALEEMKKNVEKLDELDDSLRKAVDELAVRQSIMLINDHQSHLDIKPKIRIICIQLWCWLNPFGNN
jgi:hypothetical protein